MIAYAYDGTGLMLPRFRERCVEVTAS